MSERARRAAPVPNDPLDEGPRIAWGTATLVFLELAVAAPLAVLFFIDELDLLPFFGPLLVFLLLRIPGDIARAIAGTRPLGLLIEGPSKALAWASVPFGTSYLFTGDAGPGPLWLLGTAAALFALALWGHHARALTHAPHVARVEGTVGAAVAPFALAAASTFLVAEAPWDVVVPAGILVVAGALAARAIVRLHRKGGHKDVQEGWTGWYQSHFFRLSVLVAAVVVYLFVRDTLAGIVPFLFLFEYSFAVFVAAGILWSLRGFARKKVTDGVPLGPHRRHEQSVERNGEAGFDRTEAAFGRYLETGDPDEVALLARRLEQEGVPVGTSLQRVLAHVPERGVLLVHPGWSYGARLFGVALLAWVAGAALPADFGSQVALLVLAGGLYTAQWNRFGGPWIIKSALGLVGFSLFIAFLRSGPGLGLAATPLGVTLLLVLLALPLVHPFRAQKDLPVPRFLYHGLEPLDAIDPLIQRYDKSAIMRGAWSAAIGLVVFILVGELSEIIDGAGSLFSFYLAFAFAFFVDPVLVTAGLRSGKTQVRERHAAARRRRESLLQDALDRLGGAMASERSLRQRPRSG